MPLTLLILVVFAYKTSVNADLLQPGIIIRETETSLTLFHNDVVFRKLLQSKINNSVIPPIHRNLSTILGSKVTIDLTYVEIQGYSAPQFNVSINKREGIYLNAYIKKMVFGGKHLVKYFYGLSDRYEWQGNFTLLIRNTLLKIRKEISQNLGESKMKWESTHMTGSIESVEIHTGDAVLDSRFSLIDSNDVLKAVIDCFGEAYKNLTEYETDRSYDITNNIRIEMFFIFGPFIYDGAVVFQHRAEARFKGDDRGYEPDRPHMVDVHRNSTLLYQVTELPFNSLLFVAHNHKLLSHTLTKDNLPERNKRFLDTTCETNCFGRLFPQAALQFPNSSIELDMDTISPPYVNIKSESFKIWMEFNCSAKARKNGEPLLKEIFNVHLNVSASVQSSIKGTKIFFGLGRAASDVDVIDSKIGNLDIESVHVRDLCHMILEDKLATILVETKVEGKELKLNEPVEDYEIITKEKYVNLLLNLKAIGNI